MTVTLKTQKGAKNETPSEKIGVVELFAGIAGLAQGFLQTGKYDLIARATLMRLPRMFLSTIIPDRNTFEAISMT